MSTAALDLDSLVLNGTDAKKTHASLMSAMTSCTVTETMTGASSVEITLVDEDRRLLRSGLLTQRSTLVLDKAAYELAGVRKSGTSLSIVFEDITAAKLRRFDSFRKIAPGQMSRAAFVAQLVRSDAKWVRISTIVGPTAKVELTRGTAKSDEQAAEPEDTWSAANRIMGEIQWRVWARRGTLHILPDTHLRKQSPYVLREDSPGVDDIDLDYDVGKPTATATIAGRAGFRDLAPGTAIQLEGMGPGDRVWLVETITRSPFTEQVSIGLILPKPTLPEPIEVQRAEAESLGAGGGDGEGGEDGWDPLNLPDDPDLSTGTASSDKQLERFVRIALQQRGKPYKWGASGPGSFDCSGLVQYAAGRAGYSGITKPTSHLYSLCRDRGQLISTDAAARTRGAVLLRINTGATNHVAISLGNGKTMEAMGSAYGCKIGNVGDRFTHGGLLPGMFTEKTERRRYPVRPDAGNIPIGS